jgi:hypothetical protein
MAELGGFIFIVWGVALDVIDQLIKTQQISFLFISKQIGTNTSGKLELKSHVNNRKETKATNCLPSNGSSGMIRPCTCSRC